MKKSISVIFISLILFIAALALTVSAEGGKCGDNLEWEYSYSTLIISGKGAMYDYEDPKDAPWYGIKESIPFIIIKDGVTTIGKNAFCNSYFRDVIIPDSVTEIREGAFNGCRMSSLKTGNGVRVIGDKAFLRCTTLQTLKLGDSLEKIGIDAFYDTYRLKYLYIPSVDDWCDITFENKHSNPIQYAEALYINGYETRSVTLPWNLTNLGDYAFYGCKCLDVIELNKKLETIGDYCFDNTVSLSELDLPASLKDIGYGAFRYSKGLKKINVDTDNPYYKTVDGVLFNKRMTELIRFPINSDIKEYTVPQGVECIGEYAFYLCTSLNSVTISDSVLTISEDAFDHCTSLRELHLGSGVKYIDGGAFCYCESLKDIYIEDLNNWFEINFNGANLLSGRNLYLKGELVTELVIPENIKAIPEYAFYGCISIESIVFHDNIEEIGGWAFAYTYAINVKFGNNIKRIGNYAFSTNYIGEYMLNSLDFYDKWEYTVRDGTKFIADGVFDSCSCGKFGCYFDYHYIIIPKSVTAIGKNSFENMIIKCYKGSFAHEYAVENNIEYELLFGFEDVKENAWYYDAVKYVAKNGYMNGMSNDIFSPGSNITREQFVLILANKAGVNTDDYKYIDSGFSDVKIGKWYSGAVTWAVKRGYVNGMSETEFGTGQSIQRAALVRMLYNYAQKTGENTTDRAYLNDFADAYILEKESNLWMKEPMQWAVAMGIINGVNKDGLFLLDSKGYTTRAQTAQILKQFDLIK